jgi:hypothetical protein
MANYRVYRRLVVLSGAVALSSLGTQVATSSAQSETSAVCIVQGPLHLYQYPSGTENVVTETGRLDFRQGTYQLYADVGVCAGVFDGVPAIHASRAEFITHGYFDMVSCGTGVFHDLGGYNSYVGGSPLMSMIGYELPVVGGAGPMLIGPHGSHTVASLLGSGNHVGATTPDGNHAPAEGNYSGAGVFQLTPGHGYGEVQSDNCVTPKVTLAESEVTSGYTDDFQVAGFFVATRTR